MFCPKCDAKTLVQDSSPFVGVVNRRRLCRNCGTLYYTQEQVIVPTTRHLKFWDHMSAKRFRRFPNAVILVDPYEVGKLIRMLKQLLRRENLRGEIADEIQAVIEGVEI